MLPTFELFQQSLVFSIRNRLWRWLMTHHWPDATHLTLYDNNFIANYLQRLLEMHLTDRPWGEMLMLDRIEWMHHKYDETNAEDCADSESLQLWSGTCGWDVWIQCDALFTGVIALLAASEWIRWNRITVGAVFTFPTVHKLKMQVHTLTLFCYSACKTSMYRHCSHILVGVCWQP